MAKTSRIHEKKWRNKTHLTFPAKRSKETPKIAPPVLKVNYKLLTLSSLLLIAIRNAYQNLSKLQQFPETIQSEKKNCFSFYFIVAKTRLHRIKNLHK